MTENEKGLYEKYVVFKTNETIPLSDCFILRPEKDPAAVAALRAYAAATEKKALAQDIYDWVGRAADENPPLTLDELRQMNGEPIWIVAHPDWGHWELSMDAEDYFEDRDPDLYGLTMPPTVPDPMGRYGLNMLGWLAYRKKMEVQLKL